MNGFYCRQGNGVVEYLITFLLVGLVIVFAILKISPESYRNYFSRSFTNAGPLNNGKIIIKPIDGNEMADSSTGNSGNSSGGSTVNSSTETNGSTATPIANGCYPQFEGGEFCTPLDNGCNASLICYWNGKKVFDGKYNEKKDCAIQDEECVISDLVWYYDGKKIFGGGYQEEEGCSFADIGCIINSFSWEYRGKSVLP